MRRGHIILALSLVALVAGVRAQVPKPPPDVHVKVENVHVDKKPEKTPPHSTSLAEYQSHLQALIPLVQQCAAARNFGGCDPALVGDDESVDAPGVATREVRYNWLRNLFVKAQQPDEKSDAKANAGSAADANKKAGRSGASGDSDDDDEPETGVQQSPAEAIKQIVAIRKKTTSELLTDAVARLNADLAQAQHLEAVAANNHQREHETLKQVLSQGIYSDIGPEPEKNRALEKIGEWLNNIFDGLNKVTAGAQWLGRAVMIGFFVIVGALLIWAMIQSERRLRLRVVPDGFDVVAGAPSARGWELWWKDAEAAAAEGEWREAIHYLYWASISRMESMRLWPADKARTPREYLKLLKNDDPRRGGLLNLTRNFERIWYGGREADESTYANATKVARELIDAGGKR